MLFLLQSEKQMEVINMSEKTKRNFILLDKSGNDIGKYAGNNPRQAALKIANTGVKDITIREAGVRKKVKGVTMIKLHHFKGSKTQRDKRPSDPAWMGEKVNIPTVKKIGSEWVEA
jgi:hypothetical protein